MSSASQEIPRNLCSPIVHYCIHKLPSPFTVLSQINPVHAFSSNYLKIHFKIIPPSAPRSCKWIFSLRLPHQNSVRTSLSPVRVTCPSHLMLLDLIIRIIFREEYRSKTFGYLVFSTPLLTRPSWAQVSSSAPYSRTIIGLFYSLTSAFFCVFPLPDTAYLKILDGIACFL